MPGDATFGGRRVVLDCLSLTSCSYAELIRAAAVAEFEWVTLWLNPRAAYPRQVVTLADQQACANLLRSCGVGVQQIEAFGLASPTEMAAWRPLFAMGAALGAKTVSVYNGAIADRAEAIDALAAACELAGQCGLGINLEPVSFGQTRTLHEAQMLIEEAGVDAGIVFDFLHHVRAGGTVRDPYSVDPRRIRYVQVNDGPLARPIEEFQSEAMRERAYPGEGEFPITEFLALVPQDAVIGIEAPSEGRTKAGMSATGQAEALMTALRDVTSNSCDRRHSLFMDW